jgi:hypothetical protein
MSTGRGRPIPRARLVSAGMLLLVSSFGGCGKESPHESPRLEFSVAEDIQAEVSTWRFGKPAAMTIAFDDVRACSYEIIAPALEVRGFRGTFNINTGAVGGDWEPWSTWRRADTNSATIHAITTISHS